MDQANIDTILDVAARLFAEHGYDGIGIRDIARACNTPPPSIYYHFKSKQELYREASEKKYEEAFERVGQIVARHPDGTSKIEALGGALFDLFLEDRVLFLLMQRDIADAAVLRTRSVMKSHYEHYLVLIEKSLESAVGKPVDRRVAFAIASLVLGYCELTTITDGVTEAEDGSWYQDRRDYLCSLLRQSMLVRVVG